VPEIRAAIMDGLGWCGLTVDEAANGAARGVDARISADGARLAAWVVPTDEESVIARETLRALDTSASDA
jgi:acetate kinase